MVEDNGFIYPIILRRVGTHTVRSVGKYNDRAGLLRRLEEEPAEATLYAIQYFDCRNDSGFHRKTRVFFVDGALYPVASLSSDIWNIHSGDRYRIMPETPETQEVEKQVLRDPNGVFGQKTIAKLYEIQRTIALDFMGIDFALDRAGRLVIFEANAVMRHNLDHADAFPYTRPYLQAVTQAFGDMVRRRIDAPRSARHRPVSPTAGLAGPGPGS